METAVTFVKEWIRVKKAVNTGDGSKNYGPLDKEFSEGILEILTESDMEETVENLDTFFASRFEFKHPRWMDLFLDVRQMLQSVEVEGEEKEEKWELIGTSQ